MQRALAVSRRREMEENGPVHRCRFHIGSFLVLCVHAYMFYARIKFLEFRPFYACIKHIRIKHKNILGKLDVHMCTCTTKTHFTFFHSECRFQGTVANKNKLRRAIHITKIFFMSTRFMSTRSKKSQPKFKEITALLPLHRQF